MKLECKTVTEADNLFWALADSSFLVELITPTVVEVDFDPEYTDEIMLIVSTHNAKVI